MKLAVAGTRYASCTGASANKTKQSGGLWFGEGVSHETPEYGDMKQAEQTYPQIKRLIQQHAFGQQFETPYKIV